MPLVAPAAVLAPVAVLIETTVRELLHGPHETVEALLEARGEMTVTIGRLAVLVRLVLVVRPALRALVVRLVAIGSTLAERATVPAVPTGVRGPTVPADRCADLLPAATASIAVNALNAVIAVNVLLVATGRSARPAATGRNGRAVTARRAIGSTATIARLVPVAVIVLTVQIVLIVVTVRRVAAVGPAAVRHVAHRAPVRVAGRVVRCGRVGTPRGRPVPVAS